MSAATAAAAEAAPAQSTTSAPQGGPVTAVLCGTMTQWGSWGELHDEMERLRTEQP